MFEGTLAPRTNRESWTQLISVTDPDTDQPFDMTGFTVEFEVRRLGPRGPSGGAVDVYYDCSPSPSSNGPTLSATTSNGAATIPAIGVIQVAFTETQMATLCPQTYAVGCTISNGTDTKQILRCRLPILSGWVT